MSKKYKRQDIIKILDEMAAKAESDSNNEDRNSKAVTSYYRGKSVGLMLALWYLKEEAG